MKTRKFSRLTKFILGLIFYTIPLIAFSQNDNEKFINPISQKEVSLNQGQSKKLDNIKKNPLHKSVQCVKIGNLSKITHTNKGALPVKIPGINKSFVVRPIEVEFISDSNYIWKGEFLKAEGTLTLICQDGETFGHMTIDDKIFEIHSFGKGKNILIEYDNKELSKHQCGVNERYDNKSSVQNSSAPSSSLKSTTTKAIVRILVLYTDAAANAVSSISNTATLAISQINDALRNSNIYSHLSVNIASIQSLNFNESGNIRVDVENFSQDTTAHNLRNAHQADLVVLLTDGNYGSIMGIVDKIGPDNANAYAIVEADKATPKYTFTHEVGRLFGGCHENDYGNGTSYEHGYHFQTGWWIFKKDRITIMHRLTYDSRILNFSNPDVEYKDEKTGTTLYNNVARKLRQEAQIVEDFRAYTPPLSVDISGPSKGENSGTYTWTAIVSSGAQPYSYVWHYSLDGYNYTGTLGTSSSITAQLPLDNDLFLRVTVTSSDAKTAVGYHTTINMDATFDNPKNPILKPVTDSVTLTQNTTNELQESVISEEIYNNEIIQTVFPNPVTDISTIRYYLCEDAHVIINILDIHGRLVKSLISEKQDKGAYSLAFNTDKFDNGIYFIQITAGDKQENQKILVQ